MPLSKQYWMQWMSGVALTGFVGGITDSNSNFIQAELFAGCVTNRWKSFSEVQCEFLFCCIVHGSQTRADLKAQVI